MLKIAIADDHEMVREGVKNALVDLDSEMQIFEAEDLSGVRELLEREDDLDLLLLDLKMPGMNGLDCLNELKEIAPTVAIAILSALKDRSLIQQALDSGADGYIPKVLRKEIMLNAIRLILSGEVYLPSILLEEAESITSKEITNKSSQLTQRQQEVFGLIRNGLSNKEIAREIGCTEGTVKAHVTSILKTLGVTSRVKAIALAESDFT